MTTKIFVKLFSVDCLKSGIKNWSFDSDAVLIGIDTCTTASLSGNKSDFVGKLNKVDNVKLRGVGGTLKIMSKGVMRLRFVDDKGIKQTFDIKDSYYVPGLKLRLLSPQQWSKQGPTSENGYL